MSCFEVDRNRSQAVHSYGFWPSCGCFSAWEGTALVAQFFTDPPAVVALRIWKRFRWSTELLTLGRCLGRRASWPIVITCFQMCYRKAMFNHARGSYMRRSNFIFLLRCKYWQVLVADAASFLLKSFYFFFVVFELSCKRLTLKWFPCNCHLVTFQQSVIYSVFHERALSCLNR